MTVDERPPLVEMRNISVAFGGVHAVRDVSIDLRAGEVIGLVGGLLIWWGLIFVFVQLGWR